MLRVNAWALRLDRCVAGVRLAPGTFDASARDGRGGDAGCLERTVAPAGDAAGLVRQRGAADRLLLPRGPVSPDVAHRAGWGSAMAL